MKTLISYLICLFSILFLIPKAASSQVNNIKDTTSKPILYLMADELPTFKGGNNKLQEFINKNIKWPNEFDGSGIVIVSFIVKNDGSIYNIRIEKGLQTECDAEAIRVIKLMPNWKPGKLCHKPVDVIIYLPIKFILH
ncbi:MAG: energy transducer TonB [Bacteroidales bacterium]|jgi:hypothetical protein